MSRNAAILVLALLGLGFLGAEAGLKPRQDELEVANRHFEEHSYSPALEAYRLVLAQSSRSQDELGQAAVQSGICLQRLKQWDEALKECESLEPRFEGSIWLARLRALRGTINLTMPHYYYVKGEERSRERWIQGSTYHYSYYDDVIAALKTLTQAWELYRPYYPSPDLELAPEEARRRGEELGRIGFDLAAAIEAHRQQKGGLLGIEPHPEVLADLNQQVPELAASLGVDPQSWFTAVEKVSLLVGLPEQAAMARYLEAMYAQRLMTAQPETKIRHADGQTEVSCRVNPGEPEPRFLQLPPAQNPFRLLKALIERYPDTSVVDVATYALAQLQQQAELYVQALETVSDFESKLPKSRWNSDVQAMRQDIRFPRIASNQPAPVRPGKQIDLEVAVRNVKDLQVQAFRFDLGQVMTSSRYLREEELNLSKLGGIIDKFGRSRIVADEASYSQVLKTPDLGKHLGHEISVPLTFSEAGAYLIELSGSETTYRVLALVSDIAIIRKTSSDGTLVFVANSSTGHGVESASVTVRQKHHARGIFGSYEKMTWDSGSTDARGQFERQHEDSSGRSIYIEAYAQVGEHYAATLQSWSPSSSDDSENTVLYGFTDRPVYRPGETISWVANLRALKGEDYQNLNDESFAVTVTDPKGNKIFDESLRTDEFGTIAADIVIGEEPPLGSYNIQYRRHRRYIGSHSFRVEEFKKPEFEVTVTGPKEPVRVGDVVTATVAGRYYFGAAVADAKVVWRAYRENFHPTFNLTEPYSWLYGRRSRPTFERSRGRELILQGEGQADAEGVLEIAINTADWALNDRGEDHRVVIEADVTDLSRRTISGGSSVVVPRRGLFLHVEANRGFYRAGESAQFELRAQSPDGRPQATKGHITVFRVEARRDGDEIVEERQQVHSVAAETASNGHGTFTWQTDAAGRFVVQYTTQDRWAEAVVGEHATWVTDPSYRADDFQFKNLEILTDKAEYVPGDRAMVMLSAVFPDSQVLVTVEAGPRMLSHQIVNTTGKMTVLSLDIPEGFSPNVFIHALTIHDGAFYEAYQEVFIPPAHRFVDLTMKFDKPVYQPGEMATLTIDARDLEGKAVDAQMALRVMDRSITYIENDSTEDIRKFFYGSRRSFLGRDNWNSNSRNSQQFRFDGELARSPRWIDYNRHGRIPGYYLDLNMTDSLYDLDARGASRPESKKERARQFFKDGGLAGNDDQDWGAEGKLMDHEEAESESPRRGLLSLNERASAPNSAAPMESSMEASEHDLAAPELRSNFSNLATWQPKLRTGADGQANLQFRFPDSLTDWLATVRGLTKDTRVGTAEATVRTKKNVMVRLQAPRFFTEQDEVVLSALVRNDFDEAIDAIVSLETSADCLAFAGSKSQKVRLEANQEVRVDWPARVVKSGSVDILAKVLSSRESDAMQMSFPVLRYGATKTITQSGVIEGSESKMDFAIDVPADRRVSESRLELTLSPSLAATMMESLPYLIEYPYGCTEQTMSRFMPAVIVARTLKDMGTSLDAIAARRQDLSNRDALNYRNLSPTYSDAKLEGIVAAGLRRLESLQNSDGGFGWWARDTSSLHLTAYVLQGLCEARDAGRDVPERMLDRAATALEEKLKDHDDLHSKAYATFALARAGRKPMAFLNEVFAKRDQLSTQGKAQLALAMKAAERTDEAALILRNLEDFAKSAPDEGLVWWEGGASWWRWYDDEVETNAWVLMAIAEINPQHRFAKGLLNWMIHNRSGNRWKSTRDTAISVLAMAKLAKGLGELSPDYEIVVRYDGQVLKRVKVDADNMFAFDNKIILEGDAIATGQLPLQVERHGSGSLYVDCRVSFFSQEDRIAAAGYQVEVKREYYLLTAVEEVVEVNGRKEKRLDYERKRLDHMAQVQSGDEIEVKLIVTAQNNYEYIMLEDRKPSGFEPLALRSGGRYANGLCSNMELRDEKVVFFVTWLQRGSHEISYRMRAEMPGTINAMPTRAEAMYAPKIGGISDSWRVVVTDPSE